ncbi:hypothetical protein P7K49_001876 [Saguinus oedipus]|uniref:Uncharacterized protein n=1 Tax=Saguinus oedipus TaxID=9490 RepID=A0ABQ9WG82_SAGOE|nr:hypothetical protein P7K49_001876 [Saguinus oedipus]
MGRGGPPAFDTCFSPGPGALTCCARAPLPSAHARCAVNRTSRGRWAVRTVGPVRRFRGLAMRLARLCLDSEKRGAQPALGGVHQCGTRGRPRVAGAGGGVRLRTPRHVQH